MNPVPATTGGAGLCSLARRAITGWALLGGVLLLAVVLVNVWTVIGGMIGFPFAGDFELSEIGVAVAAFMFLPYCQVQGENVTADVFTSNASPRWLYIFTAIGGALAFVFGCLLIWRMYFGMLDQKAYNLTSAILQFPVWVAFIPILISIAFLILAALVTLVESVSGAKNAS
ncbi:TRAP transporter small permease [Qingshengfaniella alkalisoli]|uniref:TRAP transporter small permease protein n=1 Tax=Qingshengfaniella alkalisoli TaxID=2599296 RepID=A0A5B8IS94_9RHOB|nr:TRAP transporter small permease [Qingshengfaniella alkalisoli]QDY69082.1 TRAP transporter small permease [Qingshengfaniella alkalisoli]